MGFKVGIPILKLSNITKTGKHSGRLGAVVCENLQERWGKDTDINKDLSYKNEYTGITSGLEFEKIVKQEAEEYSTRQKENGGRALRKDANIAFSLIVKPPAEEIEKWSEEKRDMFYKDTDEIIYEFLGKGADGRSNVRSTARHRDEQGDHKHYLGMPYTADGRLCAKEVINLVLYGKLNVEYPKRMREKGWDIDNCSAYDVEAVKNMSNEEKAAYKEERIAEKKAKPSGQSSKVYKAQKEYEKLKQAIEDVTTELNTATTELENTKKILTAKQVKNINAEKTWSGAIKNIKYTEYEALKRTASFVDTVKEAANRKIKIAEERASKAESKVSIAEERAAEAERRAERAENDRPSIQQEFKYSSLKSKYENMVNRLTRIIDMMPEPFCNWIKRIINDREPLQITRDINKAHTNMLG